MCESRWSQAGRPSEQAQSLPSAAPHLQARLDWYGLLRTRLNLQCHAIAASSPRLEVTSPTFIRFHIEKTIRVGLRVNWNLFCPP
jgi:hypothetical protein